MRFKIWTKERIGGGTSKQFRSYSWIVAALISGAALLTIGGPANAATSANAQSPLGINLTLMSYYTAEQPFLNIFKTTSINGSITTGWSTRNGSNAETNEESYLQFDANGYPSSMRPNASDANQQYTQICALLLAALPASNGGTGPRYRSGQYVVLYDGSGSLTYGMDASLVSTSPGRDVFNVANPVNGVWLCIANTVVGNNVRNIRVVKAEEESLLAAGNVYTPNFLSLMNRFKVIRAMQWLNIDGTPTPPGIWANRPQQADAGWGTQNGVPFEAILSLCNATGADCWLNVPHTADNNYISQLAALAHGLLNSTQKVYIEFSNEVWNNGYPQYQYAANQGAAMWPNANASTEDYNRSWYGMRVAQTCDIWKSAWGTDASRVVCVMGAFIYDTTTATKSLNCPLWTGAGNAPCSSHGISVVAIAPYFAQMPTQTSWLSNADGGLSALFAAIDGNLPTVASYEAAYATTLQPYNLPLITYEGGQSLVAYGQYSSGSPMLNLFILVNRDARMSAAYSQALTDWKTSGGSLYTVYSDISPPGEYGSWGALESFMDTVTPLTSAPPKWQAIQNFITNNPCWWPGCSGNTGVVPMAPTNLHIVN